METLARAIVAILASIEFTGEELIDLRYAVKVMEMTAATLQNCTPDEKLALKNAASKILEEEKAGGAPTNVLEFYRDFLDNLGLEPCEANETIRSH